MTQSTIAVVAIVACVSALGAAAGNARQVSSLRERVDSMQVAAARSPARRETPAVLSVATHGIVAEGSLSAPITIVEFTDYQCPFCRRFAEETLPLIRAEYIKSGQIKVIIRDLPLAMHEHAPALAAAARCVHQLEPSKFIEFHDQVFASQASLSTSPDIEDRIQQIGEQIGVPTHEFKTCRSSPKIVAAIDRDVKDARAHGLTGTPAFIIGSSASDTIRGRVINGAAPIAQFRAVIDSLVNSVTKR